MSDIRHLGYMEIPDLVIEVLCTTALFIALELTVIIPLIRRAFTEEINSKVIPSLKSYIDTQIEDFKDSIVPTITEAVTNAASTLWNRIRGRRGGSKRGVNAFVDRVLEGEDPDEIAASYSADVVDSGLTILQAVADRINEKKQKENQKEDPDPHISLDGFLSDVS